MANRVLDLDRVGRNWFRIESLKSKVTFLQSPLAHFSSSFKMRRAPVRVLYAVHGSLFHGVLSSSFNGVRSTGLLQWSCSKLEPKVKRCLFAVRQSELIHFDRYRCEPSSTFFGSLPNRQMSCRYSFTNNSSRKHSDSKRYSVTVTLIA